MANVYSIRLSAIQDHLKNDNDYSRYEREVSRLHIDLLAQLKRCVKENDPCLELVELQEKVDDILCELRTKRSS